MNNKALCHSSCRYNLIPNWNIETDSWELIQKAKSKCSVTRLVIRHECFFLKSVSTNIGTYICKLGGLFTQVVIIKHGGGAASDGHIMRPRRRMELEGWRRRTAVVLRGVRKEILWSVSFRCLYFTTHFICHFLRYRVGTHWVKDVKIVQYCTIDYIPKWMEKF